MNDDNKKMTTNNNDNKQQQQQTNNWHNNNDNNDNLWDSSEKDNERVSVILCNKITSTASFTFSTANASNWDIQQAHNKDNKTTFANGYYIP